jgi:SAM-dependent methyltransferase
MPYSYDTFNQQIEDHLKTVDFTTVLDVGCGAGKYAELIRRVKPTAAIYGIEVNADYLSRFSLNEKYIKVFNLDVVQFMDTHRDLMWDIVICGDVIEHLKKSDGIDLLNFLVYRCKEIILVWPVRFVQRSWEGHASESHMSIWEAHDFQGFDFRIARQEDMRMAIIKGYL